MKYSLPISIAFWIIAFLACATPTHLALRNSAMLDLRAPALLGTLALIAIIYSMSGWLRPRVAAIVAILSLSTMLLVRLLFYGLTEFSGFGFTNELFIHLEPESFSVAWDQYHWMILSMLATLVLVTCIIAVLVLRMARPPRSLSLALFLPAAMLALISREGLPEWMLADSALQWYLPKRLDLTEAEQQLWRDSGLVKVDLTKKADITAETPERPRNLILLYIESGGLRVIDPPQYPGLMPNLTRLVQDHSLVPFVHTSSYITIEGIVNSQCGTLFPFERESEALIGDGTAEEMPCLGDILREAGYRQSYLGGASLSFAGKGVFLRAHGYDNVIGMREWAERGLHQRSDTWGISDADLFEQSMAELATLRESGQPFNLTLLTIGTHIPGFLYSECSPYGDGKERFLNALHCTDQLVKRWLDRLEAEGYLEDSLVVITGDHHVFPSPEMQRLFGKDAVADRRLPFVVLGDGSDTSSKLEGAGMDLAPTVLDLLQVKHNATFALGRSLLKSAPSRNYFVSRYVDIFQGQSVDPDQGACSTQNAPSPPLNSCDKNSLLTLLRIQNAAYSRPVVHLNCDRAERTRVLVPDSIEQPMQFLVDGVDQAGRFSWMERTVQKTSPGFYMISFDRDGNLKQRTFYPAEDARERSMQPVRSDGVQAILAVWRSDGPSRRPPAWFEASARQEFATAGFLDASGNEFHPLKQRDTETGSEYVLESQACANLMASE